MLRRKGLMPAMCLLMLFSLSLSIPTFANPIAPENVESVALNTTYTLTPVADAHVNQAYPTTNYGASTELRLDSNPVKRGYLRFNVSGLSGTVTNAILRLYANSSLTAGYSTYQVSNNTWGESTLNYSNAPGMGTLLGSTGSIASGAWTSVDVTKYITGNGTFSFGLVNSSATALSLASREATNKPQLIITTATSPTPTPTKVLATATKAPPTATKIPPTATPNGTSNSLTVNPVADAHVNAAYPSTNYGTDTELRLDGSPVKRSYLRFNVSGLSGTVSRATLSIYANANLSAGMTVNRVADNTWGESTITYNNAPGVGSAIAQSGAINTGTWVSIDVTSYVTGNGTFSLALTTASDTTLSFASRETTNKPRLVLTTGTISRATATATPTVFLPIITNTPPAAAPTATPIATATPSGSRTCNFTIPAGTALADGRGNYSAVQPGNTVCLAAGNRAGLKLVNFKGTASAPITFVNSGGKVVINASSGIGIQLYGSQHVRITGTGDATTSYGIEIANGSNSAVDTNHAGSAGKTDGTEYVEFDHIYAHNVGAGFRTAKNNDLLDTGIVWSGHQFYIHDNYIKTTNNEAMYIGTSDTHGYFPIYDVQVWNNRIDDAGYDGIQIRQAHTKVLVHDNLINGTGRNPCKNGTIDNSGGFNIAKGTDTGDWYDNTVIGARIAFYIQNASNVRIYNNLVLNSGHATSGLSGPDCPAGVTSTPPEGAVQVVGSSNVQYLFNTVVNTSVNASYGISMKNSTGSVHDNIIGGTFSNLTTGSGMNLANNLMNKDVSSFKFVNPSGGDFHLSSVSPAINIATESTFPTSDKDRISRPQGSKSDLGSYEYH